MRKVQLVARVGTTGDMAQVNMAIHQFAQAHVMGQCDQQDEPRIGNQARIVEGHVDAVRLLAW